MPQPDGSDTGHAYTATTELAQDLGGLPGFETSGAASISDNGLIVGLSNGASSGPTVWHNGVPFNLNEQTALPPGIVPTAPRDINGSGAILSSAALDGNSIAVILTPAPGPGGDISGDCRVDVVDLIQLLGNWSATDSFAEIDGNGTVGVADLLLLLGDWTE